LKNFAPSIGWSDLRSALNRLCGQNAFAFSAGPNERAVPNRCSSNEHFAGTSILPVVTVCCSPGARLRSKKIGHGFEAHPPQRGRAPDCKEIAADGVLHKIVDTHLIITFYTEDSVVTGEVLTRDDRASGQPSYRIAAIEEERQRLDFMAVRVPTKAILAAAVAASRLS
jgi:hypothetical protein